MNRKLKPWLFAGGVLIPFSLFAWRLPFVTGSTRLIVQLVLLSLGVSAAVVVYLLVRARARAAPPEEPAGKEVDLILAAAQRRLATAKGKAAAAAGRLPVILFAGPSAGAKTTVITRSGMEPELLAGEVQRNDKVVPTDSVNVWYAQDHLILEAGGRILDDEASWKRLIRQVQPKRLSAVLSRGEQAPRLAVVCFPCDEFLKPGSADAVIATARRVRERLSEVSQQIGIRLPVYVLFTKADELPYFEDFVRNLAVEETRDVIGATLPIEPPGPAGTYAERQSKRFTAAFRDVVRSLTRRRIEVLGRETEENPRAGAYEFPREFQKISDLAVQFLLDLCRPSQLGVTPFLRGFYFTGVRPVIVTDAAAVDLPSGPMQEGVESATGVFDMRRLQPETHAQPPSVGSRRVPQWVFLDRIFHDVILRDEVARQVTAGGTRVDLMRRSALGTLAAILMVACLGMTWSFVRNLSLQNDAEQALQNATRLDVNASLLPRLQALDGLRKQDSLLSHYEHVSKPLGLRWGLYSGDHLHEVLRPYYFEGPFRNLLWESTSGRLNAALGTFSGEPAATAEYDDAFEALKAYLLTTEYPDSALLDLGFLPRVLPQYWPHPDGSEEVDSLGRAQFSFFASELPHGSPLPYARADIDLVRQTREYLNGFTTGEQLYGSFVSELSRDVRPVTYSGLYVSTNVAVPGAFTREGWVKVTGTLDNLEDLFNREEWVTGEPVVPTENLDSIKAAIRDRYENEYVGRWIGFLQGARVDGFGAGDATAKLSVLQAPSSPLLELLSKVSDNTTIDDSASLIFRTFVPTRNAVPQGMRNAFNTETNQPYLLALGNLSSVLGQMDQDPSGGADQVRAASGQVSAQAQMLASTQSDAPRAAEVTESVRSLLDRPATYALRILRAQPAAQINAMGTAFCSPFDEMRRQFPFNPDPAAPDVDVELLNRLLAAGQGSLWSFREENLQDVIDTRGERILGARLTATRELQDFFRQLAGLSRALYGRQGEGPRLFLSLYPQPAAAFPEITLEIDGRRTQTTLNNRISTEIPWDDTHNSATLSVGETVVATASGSFAVLRLLREAQWGETRPGEYSLSWSISGSPEPLRATLSVDPAAAIFVAAHRGRLSPCPRTLVVR